MMHGTGLFGFAMGFPVLGFLFLVALGGGAYFLIRSLKGRRGESIGHGAYVRLGEHSAGAAQPTTAIYRLAKKNGGVLTVSDVVSELEIEPEMAEKLLDGLTDGRRVDMQVDDEGVIRYVFRELVS